MIEGRTIVCIASSWDYDPTSKHQIMKILSRHNDVVWINYHGTRRPALTRADLKASCSTLRRFLGGIRRVSPSFAHVTPLVIPGVTHPLLLKAHGHILTAQIRRAIRAVVGRNNKPVQVWSFAPDVPYLVGRFNEECFIYYCVDQYSKFEGMDSVRIDALERELIDRADIVVTTSEALLEAKRPVRPDTVLARHGVDHDHFAAAWRSRLQRPADLDAIPGPIFGFFGLIAFWVDVGLIARVARLRPGYSFVLIGDVATDVSELEELPNVFLLGRRPNADLPAYCAHFDAGLLPFAQGDVTRAVNPIKMYEYLAAGLPVVSTPLPEAQRYRGPITITDTPQDFARACDRTLQTDYAGRREAISKVVEHESWASKVQHLSDLVMRHVNPTLDEASMPVSDLRPPQCGKGSAPDLIGGQRQRPTVATGLYGC